MHEVILYKNLYYLILDNLNTRFVLTVFLQGNELDLTFRGFLIQARDIDNPTFAVGSFASPSAGADYSLHNCASTEVNCSTYMYIT